MFVGVLGHVRHRGRRTHDPALRVGHLASGDGVDKRLEGQTAVVKGRQSCENSHAHLLGDILRGILDAIPTQPSPGIAQGHRPNLSQEGLSGRTGRRACHDGEFAQRERRAWLFYRRKRLRRYGDRNVAPTCSTRRPHHCFPD